jgi:hypothetical protein
VPRRRRSRSRSGSGIMKHGTDDSSVLKAGCALDHARMLLICCLESCAVACAPGRAMTFLHCLQDVVAQSTEHRQQRPSVHYNSPCIAHVAATLLWSPPLSPPPPPQASSVRPGTQSHSISEPDSPLANQTPKACVLSWDFWLAALMAFSLTDQPHVQLATAADKGWLPPMPALHMLLAEALSSGNAGAPLHGQRASKPTETQYVARFTGRKISGDSEFDKTASGALNPGGISAEICCQDGAAGGEGGHWRTAQSLKTSLPCDGFIRGGTLKFLHSRRPLLRQVRWHFFVFSFPISITLLVFPL